MAIRRYHFLLLLFLFDILCLSLTASKGCIRSGIDYYSGDIDLGKKTITETKEKCQRLCEDTPLCLYFTWVSDAFSDSSVHKRCFLKDKLVSEVARPGVYSGPKHCSETVETAYICKHNHCLWSKYKKNEDWGYYSRTNNDCIFCKDKCNNDKNCAGVECGGRVSYCSWWKQGRCVTKDEQTEEHDRVQTCIKFGAVDCKWSAYGDWSACSTSCGAGTRTKKRFKHPEALHGGKECEGTDELVEACDMEPCQGNTLKIVGGVASVFGTLAQILVCYFLHKRNKLGNWVGCICCRFGTSRNSRNETQEFLMKEIQEAPVQVITFEEIAYGVVKVPTIQEFENLLTFVENDDSKSKMYEGKKNNKTGLNLIPHVLPFDEHRVKLQTTINGCDYVNATWLSKVDQDQEHYNEVCYSYDEESGPKVRFILGQDPTNNARPHYYQMLHETMTAIVIQIKEEKDKRVPKIGHDRQFSHMTRTILSRNKVLPNLYQSEIHLSNSNSPNRHQFSLFELINWPGGADSSSDEIKALMSAISFIRNKIKTQGNSVNVMAQDGEGGIAGASVLVVLFQLLQQVDDYHAHKFTTKDQETTVNIFNEVNDLRKYKDRMVNNYNNYKLLFVCLAHYGTNRSKLGPKAIKEDEPDENYDLYGEQEDQHLIRFSQDTVIKIENDSRTQVLEELGSIDFAHKAGSDGESILSFT